MRDGKWKLVRFGSDVEQWELCEMVTDLTETKDISNEQPEMVQSMADAWYVWRRECTGKDYVYETPISK